MKNNTVQKSKLGIYLHIPFCVRKCNYCDFLSAPGSEELRKEYGKALSREIQEFEPAGDYQVSSVFFGGGTPSLMEKDELMLLMDALRMRFPVWEEQPEITMECNPGTLTAEKLKAYKDAGVNRLSIGLQSTRKEELQILGRIHTFEDFLENYQCAREIGFSNISVDLMSGLPGQTIASWKETLEKVLQLKPEHLSAYSLIIEEGTPFFEWFGEDAALLEKTGESHILPSEEEDRSMYQMTKQMLEEAGLQRYEISNYALPGYESRHNSGYWERKEYVGFGLGAASQLRNLRFSNTTDLRSYMDTYNRKECEKRELSETGTESFYIEKQKMDTCQIMTRQDEMEETVFLGLRMRKGISLEVFARRFQVELMEHYADPIQKWMKQKMLTIDSGYLKLTDSGIDVSNVIFADFIDL